MKRPLVSIVIPAHNRAALTRQCLEAIVTDPPAVPYEIIVVDDASTDSTRDLVEGYEGVRLVARDVQSGFATACNDGAAAAAGERLVFLNNDTVPLPGWLDTLVAYADAHTEAAAVGAKLLFPDGTIQHAGVVVCQDGNPRHLYAGFPAEHPAVNKSRPMQAVTAACMLVDRAEFERAGGFDDAYRNSLEDVDLCLRLGEHRHEVHYCHESVLVHLESASRGKRSDQIAANSRVFRSRWDGKARRDDFEYYLADGLLRVHYRDSYPVRLELSHLLAVVLGQQAAEREQLLESRARQVFDLMRETVRLTTHVAELELDREQPPPVAAVAPSPRPGGPRMDPEELMRRAREIEIEIGDLQSGLAEAIGGNGSSSAWSGTVGGPGDGLLFSPSNYLRYRKLLRHLHAAIEAAVPAGATVLVISRGDEDLTDFEGRTGWHFPQDEDGTYQGHHPPDSEHAIEQLEALRAKGAGFIVVPATASWWLEHYAEFGRHVRERYQLIAAEDGHFQLFSLEGSGDGQSEGCLMRKTKVLFVLHNHPSVKPGGTEAYTLRLHEALSASDEFEPLVLARVGGDVTDQPAPRVAGSFGVVGTGPNEYFLPTDRATKDFFFGTYRDKSLYTSQIADFLRTVEPDVVHFQHTDYIGYDIVTLARRVLPRAAIVYTLHEYLPICNHYGQMVRTGTRELCLEASPRRCHECFPEIAPQSFFLRKRLIQAHLSEVDLFIAPSRFLLERYVDWGIPPERIRHEDHGFFPVVPSDDRNPRQRNRFGFFGVLTPFKGIDVLLRAMALLDPDFGGRLWIRGTSFEDDDDEARQALDNLLAATSSTVTFAGPYDHADLPRLMAEIDWVVVPSVWWENSPLVIHEAFLHGRPVICSDIGGMAEKVRHGVDGLHFRVGDEHSLAGVMREAAADPGLWDRLRDGIPPVRTMDEHVEALASIYREILAARRGAVDREAAVAR